MSEMSAGLGEELAEEGAIVGGVQRRHLTLKDMIMYRCQPGQTKISLR